MLQGIQRQEFIRVVLSNPRHRGCSFDVDSYAANKKPGIREATRTLGRVSMLMFDAGIIHLRSFVKVAFLLVFIVVARSRYHLPSIFVK